MYHLRICVCVYWVCESGKKHVIEKKFKHQKKKLTSFHFNQHQRNGIARGRSAPSFTNGL